MKYGFVIDNRKCIGCHACTVACKSEHEVPVGVNRTWVKQTEKGQFPHTRRVFSVMRCNHCTEAPCVPICPTQALFIRGDGIVDFDNNRCIGCKACMQACPYDALYIDPETHTAAKCNYCAHRIDVGLEPACVNVCPEQAIISGDMDNPSSEISKLIRTEQVTVRKAEKGTDPNVFYIDGDEASLNPSVTERSDQYIWSSQSDGVGHFARYAEARLENTDLVAMAKSLAGEDPSENSHARLPRTSAEVLMASSKARRVYDSPDKGILWGWEVPAYIWTKAVATGVMLIPALAAAMGLFEYSGTIALLASLVALLFLGLTGGLLVKDLDQPSRFLYVLLRPQWKSWLVRGGYLISLFGLFLSLNVLCQLLNWQALTQISFFASAALALPVSIYTAFLFAQAKGRDFWQTPAMPVSMFLHSILAGTAFFLILIDFIPELESWTNLLQGSLVTALSLNLLMIAFELYTPHATHDAGRVAKSIYRGRYQKLFWGGVILAGNLLPLVLTFVGTTFFSVAGLLVLAGIYCAEHIWVEAPQRLPLS